MLFWNLATIVVGLKVEGIWGEGGKWRRQAKRLWAESACKDVERDTDTTCWYVDWILTKGGKLTGTQKTFWNRDK